MLQKARTPARPDTDWRQCQFVLFALGQHFSRQNASLSFDYNVHPPRILSPFFTRGPICMLGVWFKSFATTSGSATVSHCLCCLSHFHPTVELFWPSAKVPPPSTISLGPHKHKRQQIHITARRSFLRAFPAPSAARYFAPGPDGFNLLSICALASQPDRRTDRRTDGRTDSRSDSRAKSNNDLLEFKSEFSRTAPHCFLHVGYQLLLLFLSRSLVFLHSASHTYAQ